MEREDPLYEIKQILFNEIRAIPKFIKDEEPDRLSLGVSGILLSSILELFTSLELLLNKGLVESAGTIGTSLWERAITLQFILTNPVEFSNKYVNHKKIKSCPWSIYKMVNEIVDYEELPPNRKPEIEKDLLYFQYTIFSAYKHGNPGAVTYLQRTRPNGGGEEGPIRVKYNFAKEDKGIKAWFTSISFQAAVEALYSFSKTFCTENKTKEINEFKKVTTKYLIEVLKTPLPKHLIFSRNEFKGEFIEYLENLQHQRQ